MTETIILNDGDVLEGVVYDGTTFDGTLIKVKGDDVVIRDVKFVNIHQDFDRIISIEGKRCIIEDCIFGSIQGEGPLIVLERKERLDEPDNLTFRDNWLYKLNSSEENGNEVIRLGYSGSSKTGLSKNIICNNRFEDINREIEIISVKCCDNLIFGNEFLNYRGGCVFRHGDTNLYAYNKMDGKDNTKSGGVRITDENHLIKGNIFTSIKGDSLRASVSMMCGVENSPLNRYYEVINPCVLENYFLSCKYGLAVGCIKKEADIPPRDVYVCNNYISNTPLYQEGDDISGANGLTEENNVYENFLVNYEMPTFDSNTDYEELRKEIQDYNKETTITDPVIVDEEESEEKYPEESDNETVELDKTCQCDRQEYYKERMDILMLEYNYYKNKIK